MHLSDILKHILIQILLWPGVDPGKVQSPFLMTTQWEEQLGTMLEPPTKITPCSPFPAFLSGTSLPLSFHPCFSPSSTCHCHCPAALGVRTRAPEPLLPLSAGLHVELGSTRDKGSRSRSLLLAWSPHHSLTDQEQVWGKGMHLLQLLLSLYEPDSMCSLPPTPTPSQLGTAAAEGEMGEEGRWCWRDQKTIHRCCSHGTVCLLGRQGVGSEGCRNYCSGSWCFSTLLYWQYPMTSFCDGGLLYIPIQSMISVLMVQWVLGRHRT